MNSQSTIQGKVVGENSLSSEGSIISCWTNSMQEAVAPRPLDLSSYLDKVVEVSGHLHGDLWDARFGRVVTEEGYIEITGKVVGSNVIDGPDGSVNCYRHGMSEAVFLPLNLMEYIGMVITVRGELHGDLYHATIVNVPENYKETDSKKLA